MSRKLTGGVTRWHARGKGAREIPPEKWWIPCPVTVRQTWQMKRVGRESRLGILGAHFACLLLWLLPIIQAGSNEITQASLPVTKRDFRGLEWLAERVGEQVAFSSLSSGVMRDMEWSKKTQTLNKWPKGWCHHRNFGFFDSGAVSLAPGLMTADGSHPSLVVMGNRNKMILTLYYCVYSHFTLHLTHTLLWV